METEPILATGERQTWKGRQDTRFPADVQVKEGYSWSEQLGIAIAALVEGRERGWVVWVKDVGFSF
jgi:replication fork protection complex subunit Tof1/Swi1